VEHYAGIDRVFGTLERLRCGWARQDREEAKVASEPEALVFQGTWRSGGSDWA
jgi:hypothetical protein